MRSQLESLHYYRSGERVRDWAGREGTVLEGLALWATIRWDDGGTEEIAQLDPDITVLDRADDGGDSGATDEV